MRTLKESLLADNAIKESLLSDIDKTLERGNTDVELVNSLSYQYELQSIGGVGVREEKLFGPNISKYEQLSYISKTYASHANEFPNLPNYKSFGKWLERLQRQDIGVSDFTKIKLDDAAKIEALAKKEGIIKNAKNIKIKLNIFPDMLLIYVHKVDGTGEIKRTKYGRNEIMYVFSPL
jgi:hypothetical protein